MPHISHKRRLKEAEEKLLKSRLMEVFRVLGKSRYSSYALRELLSHTELIMLSKRLGIIFLIDKDVPTLDIAEILKVSSSTVIRMEKRFDRGGYKNLRNILGKLEPSLVEIIEDIFRAGMPPIAGRGRWKFLDEY